MMNELITAIEAMDPTMLGAAALTSTAIILGGAAAALIRYLMKAIGYSKMYRKAGEAGWKAFIPVYNTYTNYQISWTGKFFFLALALNILVTLLGNPAGLALQLVTAAAAIALMVVTIKQQIKMAKCFGKGVGTGIALLFFPGITSLILGLGKAEYNAIAE